MAKKKIPKKLVIKKLKPRGTPAPAEKTIRDEKKEAAKRACRLKPNLNDELSED
jgi:hypothetical protein